MAQPPDGARELDAIQAASFEAATAATANSYPPERRLHGDALSGYLDRRVFGVLSTSRPDGRPHAVPVSYVRRGTSFWLPTAGGSVRARNVSAHRFGVLVVAEGDRGAHIAVILEGPTVVVALDEVPADVAAFMTGEWISCWLRLDATRVLSYAAEDTQV